MRYKFMMPMTPNSKIPHDENSKVFMAFCDVTRLRTLELLREGEKCASELKEQLNISQPNLSHHMKILVESGIVATRKESKWTYYSISEKGRAYAIELLRLLTCTNKTTNTKKKGNKNPMKPFTIVVDTSCDLTPQFIEKHNIEVMPITFTLNDVEHKQGSWQEITDKEFYDSLKKGGVAKTAQINPESFVASFTEYAKKGEDVIYLILSSGLSATYQSSQIALAEVKEKYPDCNIYPIDGISATSLNSILAMMLVKKRDEGLTVSQAAAFLEDKKHNVFGFFTVDDLMHLHRGGRLSKLSAIGGSILGVKPILNIQPDGTLKLKDKARGREAAFKTMISQLERSINPDTSLDTVVICHSACEDDAKKLADMVKSAVNVKQVEIIVLGPVIGAHLGPGAVTLSFVADITREEYER
jgi:DegV family protein with EDD domain